MNLLPCTELPDGLSCKVFNPLLNKASPDLHIVQEKFELLRTSCDYFSLPTEINNIEKQSQSLFNILHVNARSICSNEKFEEFQHFIFRSNCVWQAICVSETWLSDHLTQSRQIPGFRGYFKNRYERTGGGVTLFINEHHIKNSCITEVDALKCTQSVFVECQIGFSLKCIIGVIYKPPDLNNNLFLDEFSNALEQLNTKNKSTFLTGDFNLDLFDMDTNRISLDFFNILASYGYWPTISKSTRISDEKCSLIDNIFCNNLELVTSTGIIFEDLSDHLPIFACCLPLLNTPRSDDWNNKRVFDKSKIENLKQYLVSQLHNFCEITDPDDAAHCLVTAYTSGIDIFSYNKRCTRKNKAIKPWISSAILTSLNRRNVLFKARNKNPTTENKIAYIRHRNCLNEIIREAKKMYFQQQLIINKSNSKKMWELLKNCTLGNNHNLNYQLCLLGKMVCRYMINMK